MSNSEISIYVVVPWDFLQCSFSAFWLAENAITAHSSTGLISSMILDFLVLGLEVSAKTTSFSVLLLQKSLFLITVYIFICKVFRCFHSTAYASHIS